MANDNSIPRRTLLKYLGVGVTVAALPALPGCAIDADAPRAAPSGKAHEGALGINSWIDGVRKEDLVVLSLGLANLELRNRKTTPPPPNLVLNGDWYIARTVPGVASYIVLIFQPQHIHEQAFGVASGDPKPV